MRYWILLGLLLLPQGVRSADSAKDPLAPGKNLPSTFHPYNVNQTVPPVITTDEPKTKSRQDTYSTKGKYHCLISEYNLDPTVMILVRGTQANEALSNLLKKLDQTIEDNRRFLRLRAFIVFLPDNLDNLITEDDKRDAAIKQLERLSADLKLRHVVIALASRADLEKYQLGNSSLTVVLYKKLKIVATHRFEATRFDDEAANKVLAEVKSKFNVQR